MRRFALAFLFAILAAQTLRAVPIRSQAILTDGVQIVTSSGDVLELHASNAGGNVWTATITVNGVTTAQQTWSNPQPTIIRDWVQTNLGTVTRSGAVGQVCVGAVGASQVAFNLAIRFVALSPLRLQMATSNCDSPLPTNWCGQQSC